MAVRYAAWCGQLRSRSGDGAQPADGLSAISGPHTTRCVGTLSALQRMRKRALTTLGMSTLDRSTRIRHETRCAAILTALSGWMASGATARAARSADSRYSASSGTARVCSRMLSNDSILLCARQRRRPSTKRRSRRPSPPGSAVRRFRRRSGARTTRETAPRSGAEAGSDGADSGSRVRV